MSWRNSAERWTATSYTNHRNQHKEDHSDEPANHSRHGRPGLGRTELRDRQRGAGGRLRTTFYVEVPDLQAALDRAVELGGKALSQPSDIPATSISLAQFADPDGSTGSPLSSDWGDGASVLFLPS
jgi:Glyoxalase-like domain